MKTLFVYGTLMDASPKRALRHFASVANLTIRSLGPATTTGVLYDLGWFPALVQGDGTVHGELFEVADELLPRLDAYENAPRLYTREEVDVLNAGATVKAFAYFIVQTPPPSARIESGDWLAHEAAKQSKTSP
jgi:gamma-glutamylcyclotransferase (GGCT)/AIG2-like uncharacterized protein YtfP